MSAKDDLFKKDVFSEKPFRFNQEVAEVFEDMLFRSIPAYEEGIRMYCEIITHFLSSLHKKYPSHALSKDQVLIYDLGSSTGYLLKKLALHLVLNRRFSAYPLRFIGVDRSKAMIEKSKIKCKTLIDQGLMSFQCKNLNQLRLPEEKSDVIILSYTLQFLLQAEKTKLLQGIYRSLKSGGILLLSEKIKLSDRKMDCMFTEFYHGFKRRNGYDALEIKRKKQSLESVLFPQTVENHLINLRRVGFKKIEMINKWYNFVSFLVIK